MIKKLILTGAICALSTQAFAGGQVLQAPVEVEAMTQGAGPMGSANMQWIVPLIAVAVIILAASNANDEECEGKGCGDR